MRITVVGTGAVGGYFGGRLAQAGEDVVFVARGAHLCALQEDGLHCHDTIKTRWYVITTTCMLIQRWYVST
jgi:ketopantoate reductase